MKKAKTIKEEAFKQDVEKALKELEENDLEDTDKYVMKELFRGNYKDLPFKTELSEKQITAIVRLSTLDKIMKVDSLDAEDKEDEFESVISFMIEELEKLSVSKNRKGRLEFIKAWIGSLTKEKVEQIEKWIGKY